MPLLPPLHYILILILLILPKHSNATNHVFSDYAVPGGYSQSTKSTARDAR